MRKSAPIFALALSACIGSWRCDGCAPSGCKSRPTAPPPDLAGVDLTPVQRCSTVAECGSSADRCVGQVCRCGAELACNGATCCDGECVDLYGDPRHCGACGMSCGLGECERNDGGIPFCTCTPDGGPDESCHNALQPSCTGAGHCTCGGNESGVCAGKFVSGCSDMGACRCGNQAACSARLSDGCDVNQSPSCRCGSGPACERDKANDCDANKNPPCRCGDGAACGGGSTCCDVGALKGECCSAGQYCCLDGCCAHPCLVLGFCAQ